MTKDDMNQYRLEKIETVAPNGEVVVRMNYVRRNSIYTAGSSILKGDNSNHQGNPNADFNGPNGPERSRNLGWREKRKKEISCGEKSLERVSHSERDESSMNDIDFQEELSRDEMITQAAHALMKGFKQNSEDVEIKGAGNGILEGGGANRGENDNRLILPDADHAKVRMHPELIVIVIENLLNFEKEGGDEGGGQGGGEGGEREGMNYVEKGDIWYSKEEISEMRKHSAVEEYQEDLKTGQDFMKSLAHDKNSRKDEEMKKTIATLLSHTTWEEKIKSPAKSGKKTWDSRKARTGSMETFFMGEEGFATFEDQAEAEEDRSWEVEENKRRRRRRSERNVTYNPTPRSGRSRRVSDEDAEALGGMHKLNGALADVTLEKIMSEAKAETVAAILSVEAMDFGDE